jgi:ABC-type sugar transport system ATPase subunit
MELSDRIAVMYRGEIVALVDGPSAQREDIGLYMATGRSDPEAMVTTTTSMTAAVAAAAGADAGTTAGPEPAAGSDTGPGQDAGSGQ